MPLTIPAGLVQTIAFNSTFVAQFCLFLGIFLCFILMCGAVLQRLIGLPSIAGHIIGGIIAGPSVLNIAAYSFFACPMVIADYSSGATYQLLPSDMFVFFIALISSGLTVAYLLWVAGHETNIDEMMKVGGIAVSAGILGAILPIIMIATFFYYVFSFSYSFGSMEAIGLGLIFSATSVSIPVAMLCAAKKMDLKSSRATLGAAVVDDVVAVILLSLFFCVVQSGFFGAVPAILSIGHAHTPMLSVCYLFLSLVLLIGGGYYGVRPLVRWISVHNYTYVLAPIATIIMCFYFGFAELFGGLTGITGTYFAGLFHRMGDEQKQAERVIFPFVNAILLPLFLGSIGLQINVLMLSRLDWLLVMLLLFLAIISKLAGCFLATGIHNRVNRSSEQKWSIKESYLFGSAMVARGEVGLVIATIVHGSHIISATSYVIAVVAIVLTTIVTPIMLTIGFDRS